MVILGKSSFINNHIKKIDEIYEDDLKDIVMREFTETAVSDNDVLLLKQIIQKGFDFYWSIRGLVDQHDFVFLWRTKAFQLGFGD